MTENLNLHINGMVDTSENPPKTLSSNEPYMDAEDWCNKSKHRSNANWQEVEGQVHILHRVVW